MFMGRYEHSIDAKNRVIVPAKYRDELGEEFVISWGPDGCLFLYPMSEWQKFTDKLQALPSTTQTRTIQRQFLSQAMSVNLDKQGRILVPNSLRVDAQLEKDVVFIGMINRIEVWSKDKLEAKAQECDEEELGKEMDNLQISL